MASVFEYGFNLGGNFIAVMEGMIDSTGKFSAKIEDCNSWLGRLTNTFAAWDMASNYVEKISGVFNDITEAGATAELQLMNLKTLFGGNAEAAEAMYKRISANFHSILTLTVIKENIPYIHQTFVNKIEQLILLFIIKYLL